MSYTPGTPVISTNNSTSTPLSGGATFTGTWERASRSMVLVQSFSDVAGTLYFDFSVDGVNADSTFPVGGVTTAANIPTVEPAAVGGRYFRVRYINGASAQTTFRLEASFSDFTNFYSPLNQAYNLQSPAILTRPSWPWLDVARGLNSAVQSIKKFGRNYAVGTSFVPICIGGVYQVPQSGSATTLRVKAGGNANDTAAGSGARQVTLEGLDENFALATESLATAGASASSATTTTFTRLHRAYVSQSGTYATAAAGSHSGDIVIENGSGGTDWLTIDTTVGFPVSQSEVGAYSVASGKTAYIKLRQVTADTGKSIDLIFFTRSSADDTAAPYDAMRARSVVVGVDGGVVGSYAFTEVPFGPFTGPCDVGFMGMVGTGTAEISVEFEIFLVNE